MPPEGDNRYHCIAVLFMVVVMLTGCAAPPRSEAPPQSTATDAQPFRLPALRLPTPADPAHRDYLGVGADETFALSEIQTQILIIEVFSMYCPHCQKEAPNVNRLFERIENDPKLRGRIKVIGIGIGNTLFEIDTFRKNYAVPFPLFADRSRVLSKHLEVRRTPTFIGWGYDGHGGVEPFLFAPGPIGDTESFLERLVRDSGLSLYPGG